MGSNRNVTQTMEDNEYSDPHKIEAREEEQNVISSDATEESKDLSNIADGDFEDNPQQENQF